MSATVDYFENDEDNTTDAFDWWKAMADNGAILTTGWTEAYEIHYSGGYGEWVEGHLGDAAMTVSYCHSPGVEAFYGGNWTKSTSLTLGTFHLPSGRICGCYQRWYRTGGCKCLH